MVCWTKWWTLNLIEFWKITVAVTTNSAVDPEPVGTGVHDHLKWLKVAADENLSEDLDVIVIFDVLCEFGNIFEIRSFFFQFFSRYYSFQYCPHCRRMLIKELAEEIYRIVWFLIGKGESVSVSIKLNTFILQASPNTNKVQPIIWVTVFRHSIKITFDGQTTSS